MKALILKRKKDLEYLSDESCFILELSNSPADEDASITQARVLPGATTALHRLKGTVERYMILEGKGVVRIGNIPPTEVLPGDVVIIPADTPQSIKNTGGTDLVFLCICTPRFKPECYENISD